MGASLYYHTTSYTENPSVALERLQSSKLDEWDLAATVAARLASSQQCFDDTPEDDEYNLHDYYAEQLKEAKQLASEPIPTDFRGRLDFVRRLASDTGEGIGNILDVEGIAAGKGASHMAAKRLSPVEVIAKFGTEKTLSSDAKKYAYLANEWLGRGECIFFPLYGSTDANEPVEWCFVGNTID